MLKNSDRNCNCVPSVMRKFLNNDVSTFNWESVVIMLRPELPKVPNAGSVKAAAGERARTCGGKFAGCWRCTGTHETSQKTQPSSRSSRQSCRRSILSERAHHRERPRFLRLRRALRLLSALSHPAASANCTYAHGLGFGLGGFAAPQMDRIGPEPPPGRLCSSVSLTA